MTDTRIFLEAGELTVLIHLAGPQGDMVKTQWGCQHPWLAEPTHRQLIVLAHLRGVEHEHEEVCEQVDRVRSITYADTSGGRMSQTTPESEQPAPQQYQEEQGQQPAQATQGEQPAQQAQEQSAGTTEPQEGQQPA